MTDVREQLQRALSGAYTVERELGGGGMSRVFVARDTTLERPVVVKVLSPELAAGVSADRFTRETKLAASLQQANIVPVLAAGATADGLPYYTMPFVEGESLRSRLGKTGALPIGEVIGIVRDVAKALAYAHERGVVHRDIKPDNVLLSGGTAVVTDFGIAKALSAARTDSGGATLTQLGTSIGTPAYMAPEQAAGDPEIDYRADLYSLGCMAYELLSGRAPFHGRTPQRMLAAHMSEAPQPIGELRPDTPSALAELVMKCLAKDSSARPQNATEVVRALDSVTSGGGLPAMPSILIGGPGMLRNALALYAAAFVVVAIVARAAILAIGLPDWVFPGALIVMALGLPVILFTAYVHRVNRRLATTTPTFTPGGTPSMQHGTMATLALKATPHVSWRRAAMGGSYALGSFVLLVGGFMTLRALGIGPAGTLLAAGKLAKDEALLVADFTARGSADSSLGGVVTEAMRTDLAQSNVLRIASATAIRGALQRMRRPPDSRLDPALAREVAQRDGMKAILHGDITPLGAGFIVTARLIAAESGDELVSFRETADTPRELIPAIEKLSRSLRGKIGESLKSVRGAAKLEEVTTSSLEALQNYAEGARAGDIEVDRPKSIALLKEAVALDSTFAMAWRKLGVTYRNAGFGELADSATARAYRYRDRLPERERNDVVAYYYGSGPGRDRAKAAAAYEANLAKFSDASGNNLALIYRSRREFARAESLWRNNIARGVAVYVNYANLQATLLDQGKVDAADSLARSLPERFASVAETPFMQASVAYQRGQLDSLQRVVAVLRNSRDQQVRASAWFWTSAFEERRGKLSARVRARSEARAIDSARGIPLDRLGDALDAAALDIWFRDQRTRGVASVDAALARTPLRSLPESRRPYFWIAGLYARGGRPDRARAVLAQYDAEVQDTAKKRDEAPSRHGVLAEIALAERRPLDALREKRVENTLPDGPANGCAVCEHAELGRAFDAANMPDSAIANFESFLSAPSAGRLFIDAFWLAPILKRLGELYEAKGERQKAYASYARFVDLWKDADPDLQPKVHEARRRMALLKDFENK